MVFSRIGHIEARAIMKIFIPSPMPRKMTAIGRSATPGVERRNSSRGRMAPSKRGSSPSRVPATTPTSSAEAEAGEDSDQAGEQVLDDPVEEPHFLGSSPGSSSGRGSRTICCPPTGRARR